MPGAAMLTARSAPEAATAWSSGGDADAPTATRLAEEDEEVAAPVGAAALLLRQLALPELAPAAAATDAARRMPRSVWHSHASSPS